MKYSVQLRNGSNVAHVEADEVSYVAGEPSTYLMYDAYGKVVAALPSDIVVAITADDVTEFSG